MNEHSRYSRPGWLPRILLAAWSLPQIAGCASYTAEGVPDFIFDQDVVRIEDDGLVVGIDLWTDAESVVAVFGTELSKGGYYPIRLRITNLSDERILIARNQMLLIDGSGTEYASVASDDMFEDMRRNSVAYGLAGFNILGFYSAEKANAQMRKDWASKQLPSSILLGRDSAQTGFVFFQLPPEISPNSTTLRIHARELVGSRETTLSASLTK